MKRKYFVRGLGVGILFGALIMFAAYMTCLLYTSPSPRDA